MRANSASSRARAAASPVPSSRRATRLPLRAFTPRSSAYAPAASSAWVMIERAESTSPAVVTSGGMIRITFT